MNNNWVLKTLFIVSSIFFIGASGLLWYTAPQEGHFDLDSGTYDRIAWNFAQHDQLVDPANPHNPPIQPLGYPFLLGITYNIFDSQNPNLMIGMQIMFALVCCGLLFLLGFFLCNVYIGLLAFVFAAYNLGFLVYAQFILAEIITMWLLLNALLWFVVFLKKDQLSFLITSGIFFSISIWFKPVALVLCPLLIPLILVKMRSMMACVYVGLFSLTFYAVPFAIMVNNYQYYGGFALAPMNELNIYQVFLSKVIEDVEGNSAELVIQQELDFKGKHLLDSSGWDDARALFFIYLKKHPFIFIKVWSINVCKTLFGLYTTQLKLLYHPELAGGGCSFFKQSGNGIFGRMRAYIEYGTTNIWLHTIGWLEFIFNTIRWFLVCIGLWILFVRKNYLDFYLCIVWIFYFAIITGFDGCCRYRIFLEPILILLMALGLMTLITTLKGQNNGEKFIV